LADVTTTTFSTSIYTTILADSIIHELRPAMFMRPHFRMGRPGDSRSYDFQIFDSTGGNFVGPSNIESYTEATAFTSRAVTTSAVRVTASVKGTMADINDLVQAVSTLDVRAEVSAMLSRVLAHKWEQDATANLANFSNTTTAASGQLSYDDVLAAIAALEQRDATTAYVGGFHPKQLADVRADIAGRTGEVFGKPSVPDLQGHYRAEWGSIAGVPLYASTTVPSSGGNYQGAIFTDQEALGYLEIWGPKVEPWRDARALLWYVIVSQCYGSVEIDDVRGQTVLSSTS
jgi:hypothetical protein